MAYDAIVIGAGPTGSTVSHELAGHGYRVLLVEKCRMPRNKSCSGILIRKSIDLVRQYYGAGVPSTVTCEPVVSKGMVLTDDRGEEHRFEQEGMNIWRSSFDHWLAEMAVNAGVERRDETHALSCEEQGDSVVVKLKASSVYTEKARIVIACDGVTGSTRRKTAAAQSHVTTCQRFVKGSIDLDPHYFYAYLQPDLSEYDAWFNVKDDYLILGVAVLDTVKMEYYYSKFIDYMRMHHHLNIGDPLKTEKWIIPRIMPGCPIDYGKGRILFAGEAAGFLNPMGEGISSGMESGHAVARAIMGSGFELKALYALYKENTSSLVNYMKRQWHLVARMADAFDYMKTEPVYR